MAQAGLLKAVFFPLTQVDKLYRKLCFISGKSEKLVVSLKIPNINGMCNQRNNERPSEFDSTREVYSQINNLPNSSQFKFARLNVSTDNIEGPT